ncbi:MAG: hypothetical protein HDP34_00370 [Clostridia bacterium]|nr:hypothetical protein [Clostridia bacterium]
MLKSKKIMRFASLIMIMALLFTSVDMTAFAVEPAWNEGRQESTQEGKAMLAEEKTDVDDKDSQDNGQNEPADENAQGSKTEENGEDEPGEGESEQEQPTAGDEGEINPPAGNESETEPSVGDESETEPSVGDESEPELTEDESELETPTDEAETEIAEDDSEIGSDIEDAEIINYALSGTKDGLERGDEFELYLANQFLLSYDAHVTNHTGPYDIIAENLLEDDEFQKLLKQYEYTFYGPSDIADADFQERVQEVYSETFLNELFSDENDNATSVVKDTVESKKDDNYKDNVKYGYLIFKSKVGLGSGGLSSMIEYQNAKLFTPAKMQEMMSTMSETEYSALVQQQDAMKDSISGLEKGNKILGDLNNVLMACEIAGDMAVGVDDILTRLSYAQAVSDYSDYYAEIMRSAARNTSDNVLKEAVNSQAGYISQSFEESKKNILETKGDDLVRCADKWILTYAWSEICGKFSVIGIPEAVRSLGKVYLDHTEPIDEMVDLYYRTDKLCEFEQALKKSVDSYKRAYEASKTPENARRFNYSVELLFEVYRVECDYASEYVTYMLDEDEHKGFFNIAYKWLHKEELEEKAENLEKIQSSINSAKLHAKSYSLYVETAYEGYRDEVDRVESEGDYEDVGLVDRTELFYTLPAVEEWNTKEEVVQEEVRKISNFNVSSALVLNADLEFLGNLNIYSGGSLDLNGHTLKIYGDWNHKGKIDCNGGMLLIGCDAVIQNDVNINGGTVQIDGNVLHTGGKITFGKGSLTIGGDYRSQSKTVDGDGNISYERSFGYLKMENDGDLFEVKGNVYVQSYDNDSNVLKAGTIKVGGNLTQINGAYSGNFQTTGTSKLILNGTGEQKISYQSTIDRINELILENDKVVLTSPVSVTKLGTDGKLTSQGGAVAYMDVNGHTLDIVGDVEIKGDVLINKGTVKISGSVLHTNGTITFGKGSLTVGGDYRSQSRKEDEDGNISYEKSLGYLKMENDSDLFEVKGNVYVQSHNNTSNVLKAGTIKAGGNLTQINGAYSGNFQTTGTSKLILNGTGEQKISYQSTTDRINELILENDKVVLTSPVSVTKLGTDGKLGSQNGAIAYMDVNGHTLDITGDVEIKGDVLLNKGTLRINGNVMHTGGNVTANGSLWVDGDYTIAKENTDEDGVTSLVSVSANLIMNKDYSFVDISGNFTNNSSSSGTYTAGVMRIGKDVEDLYGRSNFVCSGTHTVVLTGDKPQTIRLKGSNTFNILQLTQPISNYTFIPDPCWKKLITDQAAVKEVTVEPKELSLYLGKTAVVTAVVQPLNAEYAEIIWGTEDEEIATVQNGIVTAVGEGTTRIFARVGEKHGYCIVKVSQQSGEGIEEGAFWRIDEIPTAVYTGNAIKPAVTVYASDGMILKQGVHYIVTYKNNTDADKVAAAGGTGSAEEDTTSGFNKELPYIVITGKGNYQGSIYKNFHIDPVSISADGETPAAGFTLKYTEQFVAANKEQKPFTSIKYKKAMTVGKDYDVELSKYAADGSLQVITASSSIPAISANDTGVFKLVVRGKGNYSGTIEKEIYVGGKDSLMKNVKITLGKGIRSVKFTGTNIEPKASTENGTDVFTVKLGGKYLTPDTDYTVSYSNNKAVGTATITVKGKGQYIGTKSVTFKITGTPFKAKDAVIKDFANEVVYTGKAIEQGKSGMTIGGITMDYETGYTVAYKNNVKQGTATVIFTANPEFGYSGNFKKTFKIKAADLSVTAITFSNYTTTGTGTDITLDQNVPYSKAGAKPAGSFQMTGTEGNILQAGTDYTVSYANNKSVDVDAVMTIKGKGNYTGKITVKYAVGKALFEGNVNLTQSCTPMAYSATKADNYLYKPKFQVMDGNKKLAAKKDYKTPTNAFYKNCTQNEVKAYLDALENGTVTAEALESMRPYVEITATENSGYTGTMKVYLTVYRKKLAKNSVKAEIVSGDVYTGKQVKPEIKVTLTDGKVLTEGRDYTLTYGTNITAGKKKGSVTISGTGLYGGSVTIKFDIKSQSVNSK